MLLNKRAHLIVTTLASIAALAFTAACGGDDEETTDPAQQGTGGTGGDGAGGNGGTPDTSCGDDCKAPPAPAAEAPEGDGSGAVLGINRIYVGDTDRSGNPSTDAWKTLGYDLDGEKSTAASTNHCKLREGANKAAVMTDGEGGVDNSFGANLLGIIQGVVSSPTATVNDQLDQGTFTVIFDIGGVGTGESYKNLPAQLFAGASLGAAPAWDGSDQWPVYCELLNDCQASGTQQLPDNKSKVQFSSSYLAGNTWVSGAKTTVNLSLAMGGVNLALAIHQAVVTADLSADRTSATNGVIAGILKTEELISALQQVAGAVGQEYCSGSTFDTIANQIRAASDIMADGSQDPNKECDGISVGLGFDLKAVQLGTVLDKQPDVENPCG